MPSRVHEGDLYVIPSKVHEGDLYMTPFSIVEKARQNKTMIPAFNVPYLPMIKPLVQAVKDENSVAMIDVARLEWTKFEAKSLEAVAEEYAKYSVPKHTFLHLDHIPVIDEDQLEVDYMEIIERGIKAGYQSVMIDASRLDLQGNISATKMVADLAHASNVVCEAELGSIMGHENRSDISYEQMFSTKRGFTDIQEAKIFAETSGCDWLSVAAGSFHGAIAEATRHNKKPEARLDVGHIDALYRATGIPLVLHGGSGIKKEFIRGAIDAGIAKINIGTEVRQAYEAAYAENSDIEQARDAVYLRTRWMINSFFEISDLYFCIYG